MRDLQAIVEINKKGAGGKMSKENGKPKPRGKPVKYRSKVR